MQARLPHLSFALCLIALAACTPFEKEGEPPVAVAGLDMTLSGPSASVTLDGAESFDPDGTVVEYEWRWTGEPAGLPPSDDEDAGAERDPLEELLEPLPEFCAEREPTEEVMLPARYCLLAADPGAPAAATVELGPGGYRFTLWVTDDDGKVAADSVEVIVEP